MRKRSKAIARKAKGARPFRGHASPRRSLIGSHVCIERGDPREARTLRCSILPPHRWLRRGD